MAPKQTVKTNMLTRCQSGSAVIETLMSLVALKGLVLLVVGSAYFFIAKTCIGDSGYQALICAAQRKTIETCKSLGVERIQSALPFGNLKRFEVRSYRVRFRVEILWIFLKDFRIEYKKSLRY